MAYEPFIVIRRDTAVEHRVDPTLVGLMANVANNTSSEDSELHCGEGDLLGPLGLFVQAALVLIAFSALIGKRYCEPISVRRSWKIWMFDTSKQGLGAAFIHFANVLLAGVFHGDPCTWYFISFMLDSTIGLLLIYIGLRISQAISIKKGWDHLLLGEYGKPPQVKAWLGQCLVYLIVMTVEKTLIILLGLFNFWEKVRHYILSPIKSPKLELVIVMFIVPFIVNAINFWIVDNFLKKKGFPKPQNSSNSSGGPATDNGAVKYFTAGDTARYYERANESESDVLLSMDDEAASMPLAAMLEANDVEIDAAGDRTKPKGARGGLSTGFRHARENGGGLTRADSVTGSQYHLLSVEVT